MSNRLFGEREKAMEEAYFRQEDAKLLEELRQNAKLDEIAVALRDKLHVQNPELLRQVRSLGLPAEAAPALFLAPLVQVAWASGKVSSKQRGAVLRLARAREIDEGSTAYAQLSEWLTNRPPDEVFRIAIEVLRSGFAVLPVIERQERIERVIDACNTVAMQSTGGVDQLVSLGNRVENQETLMVQKMAAALRKHV